MSEPALINPRRWLIPLDGVAGSVVMSTTLHTSLLAYFVGGVRVGIRGYLTKYMYYTYLGIHRTFRLSVRKCNYNPGTSGEGLVWRLITYTINMYLQYLGGGSYMLTTYLFFYFYF